MFNLYILVAAISMIVVAAFYVIKFFGILGFGLADDSAIWGQFGDYMGGSLNPILSFISIILLIKSLNLQNQANFDLRDEVKENRKTEKLRSFSTLFFNMISSQKSLLDSFTVDLNFKNITIPPGASTITSIEDEIEKFRDNGGNDATITSFLERIDIDDRIYGMLRAFYVTVKIVSEKLSNENGFSIVDRKDHLLTLINFTDFAQLRLIIMAIQFMDYPICEYLRNNPDFSSVLTDVGLHLDPY